jgi:hypothetical protein
MFILAIGVLPPNIVALKFAKQRKGNQCWLAWRREQRHIRLIGGSATLAMVAFSAGSNDIFPRCAATP